MAIRGGQVKSVKALRNSMKKGGNGAGLKRVPADEPLVVRFLQEPEEWFEFFEHYDEMQKRYWVCTDDCPYCADDNRPSKRALASVVVIDEGKVEALAMPAQLVTRLLNKYDKYSTMMDRDYELIRTGKGFDTEYDVNPEDPTRMKLSRFEVLDAAEILESMTPGSEDDEEEEEKPKSRAAASRMKKRVADEDDDDDDEDDEFLKPRRAAVKPKSRPSATAKPAAGRVAKPRMKPKLGRRPGGLSK